MNFRTLDLNLLRVFDVVMAECHVTRAAERLAMTQPAVSNALRRLRDALGDELFTPGPTGVTPTRRAQALWPTVREALQALQAELDPPAFDPSQGGREFTLAMSDATSAVLMPVLMKRWMDTHVAGTLRVVALDVRDPRPVLELGQADVAVGYFPDLARELFAEQGRAMMRMELLYRCRYVAAMRRGHPLAAPGALDIDAYCRADHLRVNYAGRPRGFVGEALAALGRERRKVLTVDHFSTAGSVVGHTDLITTLPRSFVQATSFAGQLVCRPLPFELPGIRVTQLWHRRHEHDAAQRWLRGELTRAGERVAQMLATNGDDESP